MTRTPGHGPAPSAGTARYPAPTRSGARKVMSGMTPRDPGRHGGMLSHLAPARNPGPVLHREVPEQGRRLGPHDVADHAEHQPDLLLGPAVGTRLDGVPQGPDVGRPDQPGGHPLGREPAHERGPVLLF